MNAKRARRPGPLLLLIAVLALPAVANAGIIGWLSSQRRNWEFVQYRGGIRISAPIVVNGAGKKVMPVDFVDKVDSALVVSGIDLKRSGSQLVIWVVTQLANKDSTYVPTFFVDLAGIPAGTYEVFYETAGDPVKRLGRIEIK